MNAPRASAIFLSYNQAPFVEEALRSVLQQTVPVEIVVADDGSTDGTVEQISRVLERYHGAHRVRLLPRQPNVGIARNLSRACSAASGEWHFLFEGDDRSTPDRIQQLLREIDAAPNALLAVSSSRTMDTNGTVLGKAELRRGHQPASAWGTPQWPSAKGCVMGWHASVFRRFGRIDRRVVACDGILTLRCVALGGGIVSASPFLVDYRRHVGNVSELFRLRFGSGEELEADLRRLRANELGALAEILKLRAPASETADPLIQSLLRTQRAKARLCIGAFAGKRGILRAAAINLSTGDAAALSLRCLGAELAPVVFGALKAVRRRLLGRVTTR